MKSEKIKVSWKFRYPERVYNDVNALTCYNLCYAYYRILEIKTRFIDKTHVYKFFNKRAISIHCDSYYHNGASKYEPTTKIEDLKKNESLYPSAEIIIGLSIQI